MIDAHHHLWSYDAADYPWMPPGVLRRDYGPRDLREVAAPLGVTGSIAVQARQTLAETDWLLALAASDPFLQGVVGWVPLTDPRVGQVLDHLLDSPRLRGVRHVVQDEPDGFLLATDFNRGLAEVTRTGLVYDLLIFARQLDEAIAFVGRHPEQTFVLDHIAKPTIDPAGSDDHWHDRIGRLAERDNVWCKVSGMATEVTATEWTDADLQPYWDRTLEVFGPERLMFGSDWPVSRLATEYDRWLSCVQQWAAALSESERSGLFGETAASVYRLEQP